MKRLFLYALIVCFPYFSNAQILGGGTEFSNSVLFNPAWLTGCPGSGTVFSNQKVYEPTDPIDPCAPNPTCATGGTAADVWYHFIAQGPNATIVVDPSGGFDVAIQGFAGDNCPGLAEIGCVDIAGNNGTETLYLVGLEVNKTYYFRVFGASNSTNNRTGTYTFCGSANLGATVLPVSITRFTGTPQHNKVNLLWSTNAESLNDHFVIEKSADGSSFMPLGTVAGAGSTNHVVDYTYVDQSPYPVVTYYRLKQVDINGSFKYSATLAVRMNEKPTASVSVSPNPVTDKVNVTIQSERASSAVVRIINANGAEIYQTNRKLVKGNNLFTITNLGVLPRGVYSVQVLTDEQKISTQFVSN
jgi:hypothetical protein